MESLFPDTTKEKLAKIIGNILKTTLPTSVLIWKQYCTITHNDEDDDEGMRMVNTNKIQRPQKWNKTKEQWNRTGNTKYNTLVFRNGKLEMCEQEGIARTTNIKKSTI